MDLPGMNMHQGPIYKRPAHDMYAVDLSGVETRVHRLAESVDVLTEQVDVLTQNVQNAGTHAAAHAVAPEALHQIFRFFFLQSTILNASQFEYFQQFGRNMDEIACRRGKFYFEDTDEYITKCTIVKTYPGQNTLQVQIKLYDDRKDRELEKNGLMTTNQYKQLCIFIISKSGSTDLIGDVVGDHIAFQSAMKS